MTLSHLLTRRNWCYSTQDKRIPCRNLVEDSVLMAAPAMTTPSLEALYPYRWASISVTWQSGAYLEIARCRCEFSRARRRSWPSVEAASILRSSLCFLRWVFLWEHWSRWLQPFGLHRLSPLCTTSCPLDHFSWLGTLNSLFGAEFAFNAELHLVLIFVVLGSSPEFLLPVQTQPPKRHHLLSELRICPDY